MLSLMNVAILVSLLKYFNNKLVVNFFFDKIDP